MTILFFARLFHPHVGGVEKHVLELGKRLVKEGHKVIVVTEGLDKIKLKDSANGIEIWRIPIERKKDKKIQIWKWLWKHRELMKSADIIHAHDVFFWYLPFRFIYPNKKVFTTFHGYEGYPVTRRAILMRKLSEVLSWGNICIGDFIKKWYGTHPNYVSYGAVDTFNLEHRTKKQPHKESAVFIGRLDQQTGIKMYADAFKSLKKKYPKFDLLVVGEGEYKNHFPKNVKQKGFEKGAEKYFSKYRYAFVSRYLSILEAMASKRLVIAVYDNPIKRDYLKLSPMSRFMVIAHSEKEVVEALEYFLSHPKNEKEHIENAYNWVKEQTWEKMLGSYISLWKKN